MSRARDEPPSRPQGPQTYGKSPQQLRKCQDARIALRKFQPLVSPAILNLMFSVSFERKAAHVMTQLKSLDSPPTYRSTQALRPYIYCDAHHRICQCTWLLCQRPRQVASPAGRVRVRDHKCHIYLRNNDSLDAVKERIRGGQALCLRSLVLLWCVIAA